MVDRTRHSRRATVYLMVLGCALIVSLIGVSALIAVRVRQAASEDGHSFIAARLNAQSAMELGQYLLSADANWRTTYASGTVIGSRTLGTGTLAVRIFDPNDGDLTDAPEDPILMVGTGTSGPATYHLEALLVSPVEPLEALNTCLHAGDDIGIEWNKTVTMIDAPLSTNSDYASGGYVNGDVEAQGFWSYYSVNGTVTAPGPLKDLPDPDVVDQYRAVATTISNPGSINGQLLSPAHNPWGATNADGVYYIDTGGSDLSICGARVYGTLVVNTRSGKLSVQSDVHMSPARADYPALIVDGDLYIGLDSSNALKESDWTKNFNPPGAPYEGRTDPDVGDSYPSEIRGLVHVNDDIRVEGYSILTGTVICEGSLTVGADFRITHDPGLYLLPPLHYSTYGAPVVTSGTWQQTLTVP